MKLPPTAHTSSSSTNSRTNGRRRFFWLLQAQRGNARCKPERLHGYHLGTSVTSRPVSMGKPDGGGEAHALHPRPETARVCSPPDVAQGGRNGRNLINTLPPLQTGSKREKRPPRARLHLFTRLPRGGTRRPNGPPGRASPPRAMFEGAHSGTATRLANHGDERHGREVPSALNAAGRGRTHSQRTALSATSRQLTERGGTARLARTWPLAGASR